MASNTARSRQITRKSHYVPCGYLKRWARDDGTVAEYRLVVQHVHVPEWRRPTPAGTGYREYLYTTGPAAALSDEIEHWLGRNFEDPAEPVITKAIARDRLTPNDWSVLIRFVACQDVRTPARLLAFLKRQEIEMPKLLREIMAKLPAKLERAHAEGRSLMSETDTHRRGSELGNIPAKLAVLPGDDAETATLQYQMIMGREAWLLSLRHLLNQTAQVLHRHRWTILRSPLGMSWLTSDNPVIRLAYTSQTEYHFDGGWGRDKCEILLPLGPEHVLYTMVGGPRPPPRGSRCPQWLAEAFQRFTVENAHRAIFGMEPDPVCSRLRPRLVNSDMVRHEAREWQEWHEQQLTAERELLRER